MQVRAAGNVIVALLSLPLLWLVSGVDCAAFPVLGLTHPLDRAAVGHGDDDDDDALITICPDNDLFSSSTIPNLSLLSPLVIESLSGEDLFCSSETATQVDRGWRRRRRWRDRTDVLLSRLTIRGSLVLLMIIILQKPYKHCMVFLLFLC